MRKLAMALWAAMNTPMLVLLDRVVVWWLMRRGYVAVERWALEAGRGAILGAGQYAHRSGHLNTVRGRRPRAVRRVVESMSAAYSLTLPVRPSLGRGAMSPNQMLAARRRADPLAGAVV